MKPVVIFQSDMFDMTCPEDDHADSNPWGKDLAQYFLDRLRENGAKVDQTEPYHDEDHWVVYYRIGKELFGTSFQWTVVGEHKDDWWTLQTWEARGCIGGILGRPSNRSPKLIQRIVEAEPRFRNVLWLSDNEFRSVYVKGERKKLNILLKDATLQRLLPLGEFRYCVLECLSGKNFDPPADADVNAAFRTFLEELWAQLSLEPERIARSILAAGLLTYGRLEMADHILDNLPKQQVFLDHGAGRCLVLAQRIFTRLLPMPEHLKNYMAWYEGSPATLEVGEWLKTNRAQLSWNEKQQRYTFPSSESKDLV